MKLNPLSLKMQIWAGVVIATVSALLGGAVVNKYWKHKWAEAENKALHAQIKEKDRKATIERKAVENVARIDEESQQKLKEAQNEISDLRRQLNAGTIRLRNCTNNPVRVSETSPSPSVDKSERTEQADSSERVEQHILNIAEQANTAIAQRDACVAILEADRKLGDTK